jgi:hypothetical protein
VALLLATLGVVPSHSRPQVSDDNPFSEAQFKTLKYRPDFPARFGAYEDAETFCRRFFPWYNLEHCHGALGLMTPHDMHYGLAAAKWQQRADVLRAAYHAHPERFPRVVRVPAPLPTATAAWINKPPAAPALAGPEGILRIQAQSRPSPPGTILTNERRRGESRQRMSSLEVDARPGWAARPRSGRGLTQVSLIRGRIVVGRRDAD